jgi:hypothetical protein
MNASSLASIFFLVLLAGGLIVLAPLAMIWAVNTLFGTAIAFTFKTWLAAFLLSTPFGYSAGKR